MPVFVLNCSQTVFSACIFLITCCVVECSPSTCMLVWRRYVFWLSICLCVCMCMHTWAEAFCLLDFQFNCYFVPHPPRNAHILNIILFCCADITVTSAVSTHSIPSVRQPEPAGIAYVVIRVWRTCFQLLRTICSAQVTAIHPISQQFQHILI